MYRLQGPSTPPLPMSTQGAIALRIGSLCPPPLPTFPLDAPPAHNQYARAQRHHRLSFKQEATTLWQNDVSVMVPPELGNYTYLHILALNENVFTSSIGMLSLMNKLYIY
jgi:hypothetical protein